MIKNTDVPDLLYCVAFNSKNLDFSSSYANFFVYQNKQKGCFMKTIHAAGSNYTMLVDYNYDNGDNLYRMDMVYLNPFRKPTAFDSQLCRIDDKDIKNIHVGDVGIYVPDNIIKHSDWTEKVSATWQKEFDYQHHDFELVTLLGFEKTGKLRVFGNKVNETTILLRDPVVGFKRGDDLLIQIYDKNHYRLIHNINQELLKYKLQQQMAKKL